MKERSTAPRIRDTHQQCNKAARRPCRNIIAFRLPQGTTRVCNVVRFYWSERIPTSTIPCVLMSIVNGQLPIQYSDMKTPFHTVYDAHP